MGAGEVAVIGRLPERKYDARLCRAGCFGHGGYLGMRPCEKKLKCWLLPMMR